MKITQQNKILELLKEGPVNSYDLTYVYRIKQGPTRIKELRQQGYIITSSLLMKNRSVNYTLDGKTEKPKEVVIINNGVREVIRL